MENVWAMASLWVGLALLATLVAIWLRISTPLSEIVVGTVAQLVIGAFLVQSGLGRISFLAGTGAIVLTFLAGLELDPVIFRMKWKEATVVGLVGFFGLNHGTIDQAQYSFLAAAVIGSAVIATTIANSFFMPKHLLKKRATQEIPIKLSEPSSTPAD